MEKETLAGHWLQHGDALDVRQQHVRATMTTLVIELLPQHGRLGGLISASVTAVCLGAAVPAHYGQIFLFAVICQAGEGATACD